MITLPYGIADFRRIRQQGMVESLMAQLGHDRGSIASLLYFMGLLTLTDVPGRLRVPNLVVKKLFLDRLLEIYLPAPGDSYAVVAVDLERLLGEEIEPL